MGTSEKKVVTSGEVILYVLVIVFGIAVTAGLVYVAVMFASSYRGQFAAGLGAFFAGAVTADFAKDRYPYKAEKEDEED